MEDKKFKEYFSKVDDKFEELNSRMSSLQDVVLRMKSGFDILAKSRVQENCLSQMTKTIDENVELFLEERPQNCQILDECTTIIERGALKVLRVFMEKGAHEALSLLNNNNEFLSEDTISQNCSSAECLKKAKTVMITLKELITTNEEASIQFAKDLFSLEKELNFEEGDEEELCELLAPLSNAIRLRILKGLALGSMYYSQLEKKIGVKAGHLLHHLKSLISAEYIIKEKQNGSFSQYSITPKGLKALRFLNELRDVFLVAT
jgi:DNA-binding HxlR family transcriptional regulator